MSTREDRSTLATRETPGRIMRSGVYAVDEEQGEKMGLEELFRQHDSDLRRYLWRVTGRPVDEDLLQDFWVQLRKAPEKFNPAFPFLPWAFRVLKNLSVTNHRYACRERRGGKMKQNGMDDEIPDDRQSNPINEAIMNEGRLALEGCLNGLDKRLREALQLYYWEYLTWTEVAERLGVAPSTPSMWLTRAGHQLTKCLEDKGYKGLGDFYAH